MSLPMNWVKKQHIHSGDELEVTEQGNNLLVSGEGKKDSKSIDISISGDKMFVRRLFNMPYLRGYDVMNITFDSYNVMEDIQKNITAWRGFEIVEQRDKFCKIKCIAESKPEEVDQMIVRMFNICSTLFDEILCYIKTENEDCLKRMLLIDINMTRIDLFCRRVLNVGKGIEVGKIGSMYAIVRTLEEISDLAKDVAKSKPKIRSVKKKLFVKILGELIKSFNLLRAIKHKKEIEPIYEYKEIKCSLRKMFEKDYQLNKDEMFMFLTLRHLIYEFHDLSEEVILWVDPK